MNKDIRLAVKETGVKMWQLADKMGIADTTLCRRLRKELPEEQKRRILEIVDELAKGGSR